MDRLGIAESGLVRELSAGQRTALENKYVRSAGLVVSTPDQDYDDHEDEDEDISPEDLPHNGEGYGIEEWDRP